ncbi:hypothetical protein GCM10027052_25170 [Parafrigoribacterium mesophilum]|uniref:DUF3592 domain-containing protein n=1 Tax=Parafrigoribacterium mesophilum TaxID=433646 RepID=UPI0031FD3BEC
MDDPIGTFGMIAELCAWIGFIVGGLCLFIRLIVHSVDGTWLRTHAALVGEPVGSRVRWVADDGVIRERNLDAWEGEHLGSSPEPEVYYRQSDPEQVRLDRRSAASTVLGFVGWTLVAIGAVAAAISIVLLFMSG